MRVVLLIVFGATGTLARYGLDGAIQQRVGTRFPAGILAINLIGCLLLGLIGQFSLNHISVPPDWRIGLTVGLMGGFTTFSTFGWDTVRMLNDGEWMRAYTSESLTAPRIAETIRVDRRMRELYRQGFHH